MPTETEVQVMRILSAIEVDPDSSANKIQEMGTEAVTVVSEAALGTYPGLRPKVRTNAVALLGWLDHPQAIEAILMLIDDPNQDVAVRAIRGAGRQQSADAVQPLAQILNKSDSTPILAAEAVKALILIDSPGAQAALTAYKSATPNHLPHRGSRVVHDIL